MRSRAGLGALGARVLLLLTLGVSGCNGCNPITSSWKTWRGDQFRSATQLFETTLNDPNAVSTLHVAWTFTSPGPEGFRASPVAATARPVFLPVTNAYLYALAPRA